MFQAIARGRRAAFAAVLGGLIAASAGAQALSQGQKLELRILSSRPDMVSGGDALVEVALPGGAPASDVTVALNGADVTGQLRPGGAGLRGLVSGMALGKNTLEARAGGRRARLQVTNYPITGPITSGPHLKPYECRTVESGLGPPTDANCSAPRKIEYFYRATNNTFKPLANPAERPADLATARTIEGVSVPYIVRVDSGVINRSIYRIAVLDEGRVTGPAWTPGPAWNKRVAVTFGGGAGTQYNQGVNQATAALQDLYLSRGFAFMASTELVNQQHANAVLQGEALMMLKEYFIERYGVPKWTVGTGGSGGAIQQLVITQMYPGLLDGLQPSLTYPDGALFVADCGLLQRYFKSLPADKAWSDAKRLSVEGVSKNTCAAWEASFVPVQDATNPRNCALNDTKLLYHPTNNPKGARCTVNDMVANISGRDPKTGFGRKAEDNVGVQYGLRGLNDGVISVEEFLDLNEKIGGNDIDGKWRPQRSVGDPKAIKAFYSSGLLNSGGGGLANVPIIMSRNYLDARGDIHSRDYDLIVRDRIEKALGRSDHTVIWVSGATPLAAPSLDAMTKWLDALAADPAPLSTDKVVRHKPAEAVDAYWDAQGRKVAERASWDSSTNWNRLYPVHLEPRIQAGSPTTHDVLKCRLRPIRWSDYKAEFSEAQKARMKAIFPKGVCDYSKPSAEFARFKGPYQRY